MVIAVVGGISKQRRRARSLIAKPLPTMCPEVAFRTRLTAPLAFAPVRVTPPNARWAAAVLVRKKSAIGSIRADSAERRRCAKPRFTTSFGPWLIELILPALIRFNN